MAWASPIQVDPDNNSKRRVTRLLTSSARSWVSDSMDIMPRVSMDGVEPFPAADKRQSDLLGVVVEGQFSSFFKDKPSPLLQSDENKNDENDKDNKKQVQAFATVVNRSPENARIIVFSSNEFLQDQTISLLTSAQGASYLNAYQLMANTIDWTVEDRGLLKIRSRGHFNRTLPPLERDIQLLWEYSNYGLALFVIVMLAVGRRVLSARKKSRFQSLLTKGYPHV
jgi:ABC-2 type transport system permease protein